MRLVHFWHFPLPRGNGLVNFFFLWDSPTCTLESLLFSAPLSFPSFSCSQNPHIIITGITPTQKGPKYENNMGWKRAPPRSPLRLLVWRSFPLLHYREWQPHWGSFHMRMSQSSTAQVTCIPRKKIEKRRAAIDSFSESRALDWISYFGYRAHFSFHYSINENTVDRKGVKSICRAHGAVLWIFFKPHRSCFWSEEEGRQTDHRVLGKSGISTFRLLLGFVNRKSII